MEMIKKTKGRPKSEVIRIKCGFVPRKEIVDSMRLEAERLGQGYSVFVERALEMQIKRSNPAEND